MAGLGTRLEKLPFALVALTSAQSLQGAAANVFERAMKPAAIGVLRNAVSHHLDVHFAQAGSLRSARQACFRC